MVRTFTHFRPQVSFLRIPSSKRLEVDFVGFVEHIDEDFRTIQSRIFGRADRALPQLNRMNDCIDYRSMYSERSKMVVAEVYREDISELGYCFDNSSLPDQIRQRGEL